MMDQIKIGTFLKKLRNEKHLTQEQLAEHFNVSNRTISRWESGNNMPDLSVLVEIADFYDVEIREIIDGQRSNENMNEKEKETILKVAEYTNNEKERLKKRVASLCVGSLMILLFYLLLEETNGFGICQPETLEHFKSFCVGFTAGLQIVMILYFTGQLEKLYAFKKRLFKKES